MCANAPDLRRSAPPHTGRDQSWCMTADIEVDLDKTEAGAARLDRLADDLASVAARLAGPSPARGAVLAGVESSRDALAMSVGRHAVDLGLVAAEARRTVRALADQESEVLDELRSLERHRLASSQIIRALG